MKVFAVFVALCCVFMQISCKRVTGGGQLRGANGRATVAFTGNGCDSNKIKGQVQYRDHNSNVKFHGTVVTASHCVRIGDCPTCDPLFIAFGYGFTQESDFEIVANYRSTNPAVKGTGKVTFCVSDRGEGAGATDIGIVSVENGPFAGYQNHGPVQGNVQEHECEEE